MPGAADTARPPVRTLVVEDDDDMRMLVGTMLEFEPDIVVVAAAATGEEAIALYRTVAPDVVVSDLRMPGMTGVEMAHALHADGHRPAIVFFSAHLSESVRTEMESVHPCAVLTKVEFAELAPTVRRCAECATRG